MLHKTIAMPDKIQHYFHELPHYSIYNVDYFPQKKSGPGKRPDTYID